MFPAWMSKALNLLNNTQFQQASDFLVFDLRKAVENNPIGDFAHFGTWFDALRPEQREQLIEFYCTQLLDDYGLILTWYEDYGYKGGYRFEIAHIPVASR